MTWKGSSMFRGSRQALDVVEVQVQVSEQLKEERVQGGVAASDVYDASRCGRGEARA